MRKPSHYNFNVKTPKVRTQIIASGLSLLLCANTLTVPTYAWFTDAVSGKAGTIASASYNIAVTREAGQEISGTVTLPLAAGDETHFFLTTDGTASTGYCIVTVQAENTEQKTYCISPIPKGETVALTIQAAAGTKVTFAPSWGTPPEDATVLTPAASFDLRNPGPATVSLEISRTPSLEYTVPEGAALEALAAHYGVSAQDILIYNGLESLIPGETIRIPGITPATAPEAYQPSQPGKVQVHVVAEGETLQTIADAYGVTLKALCLWNEIDVTTELYPGMELEIPIMAPLPEPTEPEATEPEATEPEATEPEATEPEATEPEATEPEATEPEATEPEATEPKVTEPEATEPKATEPKATEPEATEPEATEPEATEPKATEPEATEPKATEPEASEPVKEPEVKFTLPKMSELLAVRDTEIRKDQPEDENLPSYLVNDVPQYYQNDYPDALYGSGTVATSGCSITSLAMVASAMTDYDYKPDELAEYFGGRAENNLERLEIGSDALGLAWEKSKNWDVTWQALQDGKIAIVLMETGSLFTDTQHFIVLTGLNEEGLIMVNDPANYNYANWQLQRGFEEGFTPNDILLGYSGAWIYDPAAMPEEGVERYEEERLEKTLENSRYGFELTAEERNLLARMIWVEARGECAEGQQAVAEVVLNRLYSGEFAGSLRGVIYDEGQFESVPKLKDAEPYQAQYQAIDRALYGEPVLPMDVFYFGTSKKTTNVWGMIGGHIFCK